MFSQVRSLSRVCGLKIDKEGKFELPQDVGLEAHKIVYTGGQADKEQYGRCSKSKLLVSADVFC